MLVTVYTHRLSRMGVAKLAPGPHVNILSQGGQQMLTCWFVVHCVCTVIAGSDFAVFRIQGSIHFVSGHTHCL